MRDIEKLFRKISKKEREILRESIDALLSKNHKGLAIKKLKGGALYRMRKGAFRIIFYYDENNNVVIVSVRIRREDTYKDF